MRQGSFSQSHSSSTLLILLISVYEILNSFIDVIFGIDTISTRLFSNYSTQHFGLQSFDSNEKKFNNYFDKPRRDRY